MRNFLLFLGYTNQNKIRLETFNHSRYKRSSNGVQFVPYSLETSRDSNLRNNLVERGMQFIIFYKIAKTNFRILFSIDLLTLLFSILSFLGKGPNDQKDMFDWSRYHRLIYIYVYMKALEERRPDIMKVNFHNYIVVTW